MAVVMKSRNQMERKREREREREERREEREQERVNGERGRGYIVE